MNPYVRGLLASLVLACCGQARADDAGPPPGIVGWRGNWTGLYPEANGPVRWSRVAKGVTSGIACQAGKPADSGAKDARPLRAGLIRTWLVIGPIRVQDSVRDFDQEQIPGEAELAPALGSKVGDVEWQPVEIAEKPDYERWGTTELDWLDLAETLPYKPNQVAYAHAYLHASRPGKIALVVDHGHALKMWFNGRMVYSAREQVMGLGSYVGISRQKQSLTHNRSSRAEVDLKPGWNRLLVKVGSYREKGSRTMKFALRVFDAGPVPYAEENILWAAELPERTNASPIIVGDRLFTPAEPDELLCLDKRSGNILWRRMSGYLEATADKDRAAKPVFREKIEPLAAKLAETIDYEKGMELRRQINELLIETDKKKYDMKWDGHLASHFGIVGFSTTPVSDGRHVYVFYGHGTVACYDLQGNRKWIRRLEAEEIRYSCSPALIGGRLVCIFGGMHGLDAATGAVAWSQPEITSIASLIPARIRGTDVVATRNGQIVRVSDGKLLWSNPRITKSDTGWAAPAILGNTMYLPWIGVNALIVADFSAVSGDAWKPAVRTIELAVNNRRPSGEWLDRWTPCSPVIYQDTYYNLDQYGVFYAADLKTGKTLYKQDLGFDELHHYNAIGVGASATLGGKYLYAMDNQGTCVVLEPGPVFKRVAVNHIDSLLPRDWPIPPQEILANAAAVFDGPRMYVRGEKHLFCIQERGHP